MNDNTIVVTGHPVLVPLLRERGYITAETPVLAHASISDVKGKHVIGTLPHNLSQHTASFTEVEFRFAPQDRVAMRSGDLPLAVVKALDPNVVVVDYEEALVAPVETAERVADALGLDPDRVPAMALAVHPRSPQALCTPWEASRI